MKTLQERMKLLDQEFTILEDAKGKLEKQHKEVVQRQSDLKAQYTLLEQMNKEEQEAQVMSEIMPEVLDTSKPISWPTSNVWPKKSSKKGSQKKGGSK